jgi:predicted lysophospholipase L1 biosynthesis ABC-type transport system permease subunit
LVGHRGGTLAPGSGLRAEKVENRGVRGLGCVGGNFLLLALFPALALLLAAVGVYGVASYSVEQRTQEIGIRAVPGAHPREILTLVLSEVFRMTLTGVAVGLAAAFALTRLRSAQLAGVGPTDPATFITAPAILLVVVLAAAWIPARRAMRVDPMVAVPHDGYSKEVAPTAIGFSCDTAPPAGGAVSRYGRSGKQLYIMIVPGVAERLDRQSAQRFYVCQPPPSAL